MGFSWCLNTFVPLDQLDVGFALEIADNMLTYRHIPEANNYDIWRRYNENYHLRAVMRERAYIDYETYPDGLTDVFLYYDEDNSRYLLIGSCYYKFGPYMSDMDSDLVIYASEDDMALSWIHPGTVVSNFRAHLPECPTLMKIGDRWYAFVSVSHKTVHQVGPLQYWTGDPGVDCLDVDWQSKEFSFVDGEDVCAARPTKVGDKVYVWGWIPHLYDTIPGQPWGGYINLPREIVQMPDGSLGGRIDPALSRFLNFGRMFTLDVSNFNVKAGQVSFDSGTLSMQGRDNLVGLGEAEFHRSYVTFTVDTGTSSKVAFVMEQGGRSYEAAIVKEDGKTFLKILSPQDTSHKENSSIEITGGSVFEVKIVSDGQIVEFSVNDSYALTGITAMNGVGYTAFLYSDGAASFEKVTISKLIPQGDIDARSYSFS